MGVPPEYYAGIGFAVASTLATNLGILIQKASADLESDKPLCRRWRFWAGFSLNLGSEALLTTFALALAPLSLVAPLGGLAVVFNALIARSGLVCGIKEPMALVDWLCTGLVVAGVTMAAIFGPGGVEDPNRASVTIETIPAAAGQPLFVAYTIVSFSCMGCWLFFWKQRCFPRLWRPKPEALSASIGSGFTAALGSGFSTIFLKVLTLQATDWGKHGPTVPAPLVWVCLFALMIVAPLQLYLLNMTLASGGATFTIPLYLSLCMLLVSISGAILFNEFDPVARREPAPLFIVLWGLAIVVTMGGLTILSYRQQKRVAEEGGAANATCANPSPLIDGARTLSRTLSRAGSGDIAPVAPAQRADTDAAAEAGLPGAVPGTSAAVLGGKGVLGRAKGPPPLVVLAGARPPDPGTNSASSSPLSLEPAGFVTPARPAGGRAPAEPDEGKPCLQS